MASRTIETLDIGYLADQTDNLYETVVVLSRRARQIAGRTKAELDQKLSYFDDLTLIEPGDELRTNEEQVKISLEYEKKPKPGALAIDELKSDEIYYRHAGPESPELL